MGGRPESPEEQRRRPAANPARRDLRVGGGRPGTPPFRPKGPQDPQGAARMLPLPWARTSPGLHSHPVQTLQVWRPRT